MDGPRAWLRSPPSPVAVVTDPRERRILRLEILVVLAVTLGLSALRSGLSLLDALLQPVPLAEQQVALNAPAAQVGLVDLAYQLTRVLQLVGWGVLTTVPTIFSGLADVPGLPESKRRVAVLHAAANAIATAGFAGSWILRRRSRMSGILVGLGAGAIASAGGALGGWLAMGDAPDEQPPDERAEASDGAR